MPATRKCSMTVGRKLLFLARGSSRSSDPARVLRPHVREYVLIFGCEQLGEGRSPFERQLPNRHRILSFALHAQRLDRRPRSSSRHSEATASTHFSGHYRRLRLRQSRTKRIVAPKRAKNCATGANCVGHAPDGVPGKRPRARDRDRRSDRTDLDMGYLSCGWRRQHRLLDQRLESGTLRLRHL